VLWIKQAATLGCEGDTVRLYMAGRARARIVAKPVVVESPPVKTATSLDAASADVVGSVKASQQVPPKWIETFSAKTEVAKWVKRDSGSQRPDKRDQAGRRDEQ
jgi:hypothetical protein